MKEKKKLKICPRLDNEFDDEDNNDSKDKRRSKINQIEIEINSDVENYQEYKLTDIQKKYCKM